MGEGRGEGLGVGRGGDPFDELKQFRGGEREVVFHTLKEIAFDRVHGLERVVESLGDSGISERCCVVPEFNANHATGQHQVEELLVLDALLDRELVGVYQNGNDHKRRESVIFQNAEDDIKEGCEPCIHCGNGVLCIKHIVVLVEPHLRHIQQMCLGDALGIYGADGIH